MQFAPRDKPQLQQPTVVCDPNSSSAQLFKRFIVDLLTNARAVDTQPNPHRRLLVSGSKLIRLANELHATPSSHPTTPLSAQRRLQLTFDTRDAFTEFVSSAKNVRIYNWHNGPVALEHDNYRESLEQRCANFVFGILSGLQEVSLVQPDRWFIEPAKFSPTTVSSEIVALTLVFGMRRSGSIDIAS